MLPPAPPSWMPTIGTPWLRSGATAPTPPRMGSTSAPADAPAPAAPSTASTASTRASCSTPPTPANTGRGTPGSSRRQRAKHPTCSTDCTRTRIGPACASSSITLTRPAPRTTCSAYATSWVSLRTTHQGPERAQALRSRKARHIPAAEAADRGCGGHGGARTGLGGADAREGFDRGWRSRALHHLAQDRRRRFEQCAVRALRAVGRIERTLFTLQWLSDPALRQRSHAGLNKGEASNSLRRAVFFHRQGGFRDRTFENQSFRASGLSLLTAAIVHWNTIYLDRAVQHLRAQGVVISNELLAHVAPLGGEHIALTGEYDWNAGKPTNGLRPLRDVAAAFRPRAA